MKCPHCRTDFFDNWSRTNISRPASTVMVSGSYKGQYVYPVTDVAVCPNCNGCTVNLILQTMSNDSEAYRSQVFPRGGKFPSAPSQVPSPISADYNEANEVLPISPKASAALSRRCLQAILASQGYTSSNLLKQITDVIDENDASKAIPISLRENIDAIRNFGNFSAHPISDKSTLQIIDVEDGEAEWCLEILSDMFDHFYVAPAKAAERRSALGRKLTSAGKPPMKGNPLTPQDDAG